jgi:hypothetical protein
MSVDPELDRLLHALEAARRAALGRVEAALRGDAPPSPVARTPAGRAPGPSAPAEPVAAPAVSAPAPAPAPAPTPVPLGSRPPIDLDAVARRWDPRPAEPSTIPGADRPRVMALVTAVARPVAALVLTAAVVLGGWLGLLEPALGSRPVLVRDEAMSPSLRTGDVALAVDPDGPLGAGAIVAARLDGRTVVTRVIGREDVPVDAGAEARAAADYIVRADGEPLEVTHVVAAADVRGEVGAAVPRVGLPLVLLAHPTRAPLGTLVVVGLLALTGVGAAELARERRGPRQ